MGAWLIIAEQLPSLCKALGLGRKRGRDGGRESWAGKMAQMVKAFTAKPEDPSPIPGSHMVKGESRHPQVILRLLCAHHVTSAYTHTQRIHAENVKHTF